MKSAATLFLLLLLILLPASTLKSQAPSTSDKDTSGGRPGEFHFLLRTQVEKNRMDFAEMRTVIERLRNDFAVMPMDTTTRARLRQDLTGLEQFIGSVEQQLTVPAGPTAALVETKLNGAKGQYMCGVCHGGPGMHAGGGMHGR